MSPSYDSDNIFARILRHEIPCISVYEDDQTLAFMDIMPQTDGHVLVIPKEAAATIYDLSEAAALACMKTVQLVGKGVQHAMDTSGSTVFQHNGKAAGQTVPHFHFHVLPGSLLGLKGHAVEMGDTAVLQRNAQKIINSIEQLRGKQL